MYSGVDPLCLDQYLLPNRAISTQKVHLCHMSQLQSINQSINIRLLRHARTQA